MNAYTTAYALHQAILEHRGTTHPSSRLSNAATLAASSAHDMHRLGTGSTRIAMALYEGLDHAQQAVKIFHYPQDFEGSALQPAAFALHATLTPPPGLHQNLTALKLSIANYTQSVGL